MQKKLERKCLHMRMEINLIMNRNFYAALPKGQTTDNLTKRRKLSIFQRITILIWTAIIMKMGRRLFHWW